MKHVFIINPAAGKKDSTTQVASSIRAACVRRELDYDILTTEPVSLAIAEEMLHDNGIPYLKKERGAGGVVRILVGYQSFGTDLFVRPEDEEKANEVLMPLFEEAEAEAAEENGEV